MIINVSVTDAFNMTDEAVQKGNAPLIESKTHPNSLSK